MRFPVSGVESPIWVPILVGFVISFFTSMGGISGALLILPFQMSVLRFTTPAVSATNLVYNLIAIPGATLRYVREARMLWPLAILIVAGALPGVVVGGLIRLKLLPDASAFKVFAACVLFLVGARLALDSLDAPLHRVSADIPPCSEDSAQAEDWRVHVDQFDFRQLSITFRGRANRASTGALFMLFLTVGAIGGIYGIGGGAIVAPFLVAIFRWPVHAVAGAALMGSFATSVAGVAFYQGVAPTLVRQDLAALPDWLLGSLFGIGGFIGTYFGARTQRYVPARWLKMMLAVLVLFAAVECLTGLP